MRIAVTPNGHKYAYSQRFKLWIKIHCPSEGKKCVFPTTLKKISQTIGQSKKRWASRKERILANDIFLAYAIGKIARQEEQRIARRHVNASWAAKSS